MRGATLACSPLRPHRGPFCYSAIALSLTIYIRIGASSDTKSHHRTTIGSQDAAEPGSLRSVRERLSDTTARLALLRANQVDFGHQCAWAAVEEGRSLQKTNREISLTLTPVIGQAMIYFRTDEAPFNDVRVRRAVSLAIERKAWNEPLLYVKAASTPGRYRAR